MLNLERTYIVYEWYARRSVVRALEILSAKINAPVDLIIENAIREYFGVGPEGVTTPQPHETGGAG